MKVLHVITGLNDGGAEAVLYRLCTHDQAERHHVVSLMDEGKYGPLLREAGVAVDCLNMTPGRVSAFGLWRLWRLLRAQRPDVVQTWMYHANLVGGIVARLAGIRRIFWGVHHTTLDPEDSKRSTRVVSKLCAWLSKIIPTRIVCCADKALEVHKEQGYASSKLLVIPNGYDFACFRPDADLRDGMRAEWGVGDRWILGMVGRFNAPKDHRTLLEAIALLSNQSLRFVAILVGSGVDGANVELREWLSKLNLSDGVRLLGQRSDIPAVMNALDVHVLSSSGEAFPNVVVEAMACGTPVVVTDVGDAAAIVGETGWIVPPKDAGALAATLMQAHEAMQDKRSWTSRRQAVRKRVVDNFSLDRMVQRYHEVWAME